MRTTTSWAVAAGAAAVLLTGPGAAAAAGPAAAITWSVFTSPVRGTDLAGLWAGSAGDVWAVGLQPGGACQYRTLTEHWDGSAWAVLPSPSKLTVNSTLAAASGTGASDVWAVGETGCPGVQNGRTLALHWNGTSWSLVKTPDPGFFPVLSAVAARTAADAWAVGDTTFGGTDDPLIEHWNGASWRVSTVPATVHGPLYGVAVQSATSAWAVGSLAAGSAYAPLALHWDGTRWSPVPVPIPAGTNGYLSSVTALPGGQLVAAGAWRPTPATSRVLVEEWDGTAWHMAAVPPLPGFAALYSVTAAPGQGPWASGFANTATSGGAVVLERVGTSWQLATPPPLAQAFSVAGASDGEVWTIDGPFIAHGVPG
jgi:hypothetical protein